MQFGAQVNPYRTTWDHIRTVIETMEAGRWDSLWFADHYLPPPPRREDEPLAAHEGFSLIAAAAGITERLRLGHLVLGNTYRNPALVAKMATTVDQISHGRFTLGVGAAWFQREHEAYGWDFPSMRERSDRLEEACALLRTLFTAEGPVDFNGRYYRLDQAPLSPGAYQKPYIPILVGGTGEQRTLRTLAMYGDIFNLDGWARGPMTLDYYYHKIGVLERHCEKVGRDPTEIKRTILMPVMVQTIKQRPPTSSPAVAWGWERPPDRKVTLLNGLVSLLRRVLTRLCLPGWSRLKLSNTSVLMKKSWRRSIKV